VVGAQVKEGKKAKFKLGVADPKLGAAIQDETSIPCVCNEFTGEVGLELRPPVQAPTNGGSALVAAAAIAGLCAMRKSVLSRARVAACGHLAGGRALQTWAAALQRTYDLCIDPSRPDQSRASAMASPIMSTILHASTSGAGCAPRVMGCRLCLASRRSDDAGAPHVL